MISIRIFNIQKVGSSLSSIRLCINMKKIATIPLNAKPTRKYKIDLRLPKLVAVAKNKIAE